MPWRSDDDGCRAFPTGSCPLPPNRGPSSVPNVRITHAFLGHRSYHLLLASSSELFSLWTLCPAACFGSPPMNDAAQRSSPNTHWGNGCRGAGPEGDPVMLEPPLKEAVASTVSGERLCQPIANMSKHGSHAELGPGLPLHNSQGPWTPFITMWLCPLRFLPTNPQSLLQRGHRALGISYVIVKIS